MEEYYNEKIRVLEEEVFLLRKSLEEMVRANRVLIIKLEMEEEDE